MGRTLYIYGKDDVFATVDGPSLWIKRPMKAGQRIPFSLISRVYLIGNVRLNSEVILALAENNIPLLVARASGHDRAVLLPYNHRLPRLYSEQKAILENENNNKRYVKWIHTYRSYFLLKVINKFLPKERKKRDIGEGDYQFLLQRFLMPANKQLWPVVKKPIAFLFRGLIVENLQKSKLDLHLGGYFRRANFGFVLDLCFLLEAKVDEQTIMFFQQKNYQSYFEFDGRTIKLNKEGYQNVINRFENKQKELTEQINKVIDDFCCLLRELRS